MTDPHKTRLYALIVEIRRAFNELASASDAITAPLGLTAAERAVLEHLVRDGAATVPDIARAKSVSRQHIQKLADSLVGKGHAQYHENPAHKRSQLLEVTEPGAEMFRAIVRSEGAVLGRLEGDLDGQDLDAAIAAIRALRAALGQ